MPSTHWSDGLALYPSFESQNFIGIDTRGSLAINDQIFAFGGLKYLTDDIGLIGGITLDF
jgi:hypothetical protein